MDEISLSELIEQTKKSICSLKYQPRTISIYEREWRGLTQYFIDKGQTFFSIQLAEQHVLEAKAKFDVGSIKRWQYQRIRQTVQTIIEYYENGQFIWKMHRYDKPLRLHQSAYVLLQKDYLNSLQEEGKSIKTIQAYGSISEQFIEFLEQQKLYDLSEVCPEHVQRFLREMSNRYQPTSSMACVLKVLRSFLRFVALKKQTTVCLRNALPSRCGSKTTIVPTITVDEEQRLLDAVDRQTSMGKRDFAILLLALRTGLRSIDLTNLQLGDIDWKNNTIEILQETTRKPLILPLLTDVGNAIADYILNGRPDSPEPYLFLRHMAPYRKLKGSGPCYEISCKIMKAAGIRQGQNERKGFHCLRHSVAARLLEKETPLPIISSILGHQDKESTKVYLSTDLVHLRVCALDLTGIEINQEALR